MKENKGENGEEGKEDERKEVKWSNYHTIILTHAFTSSTHSIHNFPALSRLTPTPYLAWTPVSSPSPSS